MQTLPFVAPKTVAPKSAVTPEASKQPEVKATTFNQVLSKQMAQEEAKNTSAKMRDQAAQVRAKQSSTDKDKVEATADVDVSDDLMDDNGVDKSSVDKNNVDAQLLALEVTAKTVQDVTDGKVVLDAQQIEAARAITDTPFAIATVTPIIVPSTVATAVSSIQQANDVKEDNAERVKPDVVDGQSLADAIGKSTTKTKSSEDVAQQKASAVTNHQQAENDQFVQTMMAENKMKFGQEAIMSKAMTGAAETSTIATVSLQQPAAKFTTTPILAASDNSINVYPGKAGWNEAVSQKVVWMVGAMEQTAKLTLNPPELGPLEVIINVNNDKADATFISENPEVRKALEDGVSTLRQLMGQAGVELGQANVSTSKQQQEFQQSNQQQFVRQQTTNATNQFEESGTNRPAVVRESNGLVDIFA